MIRVIVELILASTFATACASVTQSRVCESSLDCADESLCVAGICMRDNQWRLFVDRYMSDCRHRLPLTDARTCKCETIVRVFERDPAQFGRCSGSTTSYALPPSRVTRDRILAMREGVLNAPVEHVSGSPKGPSSQVHCDYGLEGECAAHEVCLFKQCQTPHAIKARAIDEYEYCRTAEESSPTCRRRAREMLGEFLDER